MASTPLCPPRASPRLCVNPLSAILTFKCSNVPCSDLARGFAIPG